MARKTVYATTTFRYQSRELRAGDPIELDAPTARLFVALGKVTDGAPRAAPTPAKPKAKPRKRAAKKR